MADTPGYPATLRLAGRRVLVVGGGTVATRRIPALLDAGAVVDVIAPDASTEIREAAGAGRLRWRQRRFQPRDVLEPEPAWLAHAATDSPAVNAAVATACDEHRVWCVRADDADASSVWTPAVAHGAVGTVAEGVTVAVTGGGDPRRAAAVRDAVLAGLDSGLLPVRRQRPPSGPDGSPLVGRVALVGGGPGDPGLVTVRGRQLLAAADVVVTDRLGPRDLLDVLSPDVEVVDVGKTPGHHPIPQSRINEILVEHARLGRNVVRLKGGDPFVLGRGGEEAIHCAANGIPVEVVPGVTSAVSVPAAAGIPVTHRGITASFVVASAHDGATAALDALRDAPVTSTVVLLMGVTALADTARRLVESGRPPTTPGRARRVRLDPRSADDGDDAGRRGRGRASAKGVRSPAVVVVGEVVRIREQVGDLVPPYPARPSADPEPRPARPRVAGPPARRRASRSSPSRSRRRWPGHVHTAYLDHHAPSATEVAERLDGGVVVPLLVTPAYHAKIDVPGPRSAMHAPGSGSSVVAGRPARSAPAALRGRRGAAGRRGHRPDPHHRRGAVAGGRPTRQRTVATVGHHRRAPARRLGSVGSGCPRRRVTTVEQVLRTAAGRGRAAVSP